MKPDFEDSGIQLYCGDCKEILPHLGNVDAVITDPPYGINYKTNAPNHREFDKIIGDNSDNEARHMLSYYSKFGKWCVFGANCFPSLLPTRGRWICWDKRLCKNADRMIGSSFELAWTNKDSGFDKMIRCLHGGVVNANGGERNHPTEKPIQVMQEIIDILPVDKNETVLDPYMGSGTTGIACIRTKRKFIGIEISEKYYKIAENRIKQELAQLTFNGADF